MNTLQNIFIPEFTLKRKKSKLEKVKITGARQASDYMRNLFGDSLDIFESFFAIFLNQANETIGYAKIAQGGIASTVVDVRLIANFSISSLAVSVIVAHNHPSGNTNFSNADISISKRIKESLKILEVQLLDSLVITETNYNSMADAGLL